SADARRTDGPPVRYRCFAVSPCRWPSRCFGDPDSVMVFAINTLNNNTFHKPRCRAYCNFHCSHDGMSWDTMRRHGNSGVSLLLSIATVYVSSFSLFGVGLAGTSYSRNRTREAFHLQ